MNAFDGRAARRTRRLRARTGRLPCGTCRGALRRRTASSPPGRTSRPCRDGPEEARGLEPRVAADFDEVARLPMPVVAAVTGYALAAAWTGPVRRLPSRGPTAVLASPSAARHHAGLRRDAAARRLIGPSRAKNLLMTAADEGRRGAAPRTRGRGRSAGSAYDAALRYARQLADGRLRRWRRFKVAVDHGADVASPPGWPWNDPCSQGLRHADAATGIRSLSRRPRPRALRRSRTGRLDATRRSPDDTKEAESMQALRWHGAGDSGSKTYPSRGTSSARGRRRVAWCGVCGTDLHEFLEART